MNENDERNWIPFRNISEWESECLLDKAHQEFKRKVMLLEELDPRLDSFEEGLERELKDIGLAAEYINFLKKEAKENKVSAKMKSNITKEAAE
jgi:hypothetical protein